MFRRYAGCLGTAQQSYQRQDGSWETTIEIRAILNPWTHDSWIRSVTMASDRRMIIVPNSSLVLFDGDYLQPIGSCPYEPA